MPQLRRKGLSKEVGKVFSFFRIYQFIATTSFISGMACFIASETPARNVISLIEHELHAP
jgi:hypothetical protein